MADGRERRHGLVLGLVSTRIQQHATSMRRQDRSPVSSWTYRVLQANNQGTVTSHGVPRYRRVADVQRQLRSQQSGQLFRHVCVHLVIG